jgi:hypothetical protein
VDVLRLRRDNETAALGLRDIVTQGCFSTKIRNAVNSVLLRDGHFRDSRRAGDHFDYCIAKALDIQPSASLIIAKFRSFMAQQPAFAVQAAAITCKGSVGSDDPVAGHNHADGVGAIGGAHGAYRPRLADAGRLLPITYGCSRWNIAQSLPAAELER